MVLRTTTQHIEAKLNERNDFAPKGTGRWTRTKLGTGEVSAPMDSLRNVEVERALEFIRHNHRAVLATTKSDGGIQLSLILAAVDDSGRVVVSTRETALKTRNLRARPQATMVVFTERFFGEWVQVEGPAEVVSLPEAMEGLIAYYRAISGEHPNWDEYRNAMEAERRVLLRIAVRHAGPDVSG
jgi:PPOX class probable F420-dependent enzyme